MLFFIRTCVQENLISYLFMFCQKIYVINLEMTLQMLYYLGMMMILFVVCYLGIYVVLPGHDDDFVGCLLPGHICCTTWT